MQPPSELARRYPTALVTGASGGLGSAFARLLLAEGVRVWGTSRDEARLEALRSWPGFQSVVLDLAQPEAAEAAFERAASAAGGVFDLVVNNASYGHFEPFAEASWAVWDRQISDLLMTTGRLAHAALRGWRARSPVRGALVNISSLAAEFPLPYMSGYNVAKAGLSALSESLIFETRGTDVTVLDFRPGDYRTSFNQSMSTSVGSLPPRQAAAWRRLEEHLQASPTPERAAADLKRALLRGRSGLVRSGGFFQAELAPLLARLAPAAWRRAVLARYFGAA